MNINEDLIGKTITGVVATSGSGGPERILWMLQFSDGTHVEFVSPNARRAMKPQRSGFRARRDYIENSPQLALNVA